MNGFVKINKSDNNEIQNFSTFDFGKFSSFDYYRLVDPITKKVFDYKNEKLNIIENYFCYNIWDRKTPCDNCVSRSALEDNSYLTKFEFLDNSIVQVQSIPVVVNETKLVLELAKFYKDSSLLFCGKTAKFENIISQLNSFFSKDPFTELNNHKTILYKLDYLLRNKANTPVTIIQMDIDCMKQINDYFGHLTGDKTILAISKILLDLDKTDENIVSGRIGGDEFLTILNGYTKDQTEILFKSYGKQLQNILPMEELYPELVCSVSWGIKQLGENTTIETARNDIDDLMYKVKGLRKPKKLEEIQLIHKKYK